MNTVALAQLRKAVRELERELSTGSVSPQVRDAVDGPLGLDYAIHAVERLTQRVYHIKRTERKK